MKEEKGTMVPTIKDVCNFFNFKFHPFSLTPDVDLFFPARNHLENLIVLKYAVEHGSLISVLTGEPGTGKTQIVNTLLSQLSDHYKVFVFDNSSLSPEEFYITILKGLKIIEKEADLEPFNKDFALKKFKEYLHEHNNNDSVKILIVVDEAQFLPSDTLEELRFITNLNTDKEPQVQIVLTGQPSLEDKLKEEKLLPVRQRISVMEKLKPLEEDEVIPYVWYRIKAASEFPRIGISKDAGKLLIKKSKCIPRIINKLMNRAIFLAFLKSEIEIKKEHIKEAEETLASETI